MHTILVTLITWTSITTNSALQNKKTKIVGKKWGTVHCISLKHKSWRRKNTTTHHSVSVASNCIVMISVSRYIIIPVFSPFLWNKGFRDIVLGGALIQCPSALIQCVPNVILPVKKNSDKNHIFLSAVSNQWEILDVLSSERKWSLFSQWYNYHKCFLSPSRKQNWYWFNVGPVSQTMGQHQTSICPALNVYWVYAFLQICPRTNAGLMLVQRRRQWANIKPTLVQHVVFTNAFPENMIRWFNIG